MFFILLRRELIISILMFAAISVSAEDAGAPAHRSLRRRKRLQGHTL